MGGLRCIWGQNRQNEACGGGKRDAFLGPWLAATFTKTGEQEGPKALKGGERSKKGRSIHVSIGEEKAVGTWICGSGTPKCGLSRREICEHHPLIQQMSTHYLSPLNQMLTKLLFHRAGGKDDYPVQEQTRNATHRLYVGRAAERFLKTGLLGKASRENQKEAGCAGQVVKEEKRGPCGWSMVGNRRTERSPEARSADAHQDK